MQDELLDSGFSPKFFYKMNQIYWSTFLGGPLAGAYLLSQNYKTLDDTDSSRKVWIAVSLFCIILISILVFIPLPDSMPNFIFPLAYAIGAKFYADKTQKSAVEHQIAEGATYFSAWRVLLISIISLLAMVSILFVAMLLFGKI